MSPGGKRLVGYVLKNWDSLVFVHQFTFEEGCSTELGTEILAVQAESACACLREHMAKRSLIAQEHIQK